MSRTEFMCFASRDTKATPLHMVGKAGLADWLAAQPAAVADWLTVCGFDAAAGNAVLVPDAAGRPQMAVVGYGTEQTHHRERFVLARGAAKLPAGVYQIAGGLGGDNLEQEALGWLLAQYRFDRYHEQAAMPARLQAPSGVDARRLEIIAAGEALTRDLINTPANDMGPAQLEAAFLQLATEHAARTKVIVGSELATENLPMILAVGQASPRRPRLLDMRWGDNGPKLTLVGKGVCFDTGGLNIKPGGSMGLMKKDMGGAATVMGLAHMIMALKLPVQLRLLVPAVENAIDGSAMRPQDILTSRKGLTVEINNTDAEGRLVLADALTLADEEKPDLLISMATLTGAARVAMGPDLPPYFTENDGFASALSAAGNRVWDPLWRLPFWEPYEEMIEPGIADLDNAPKGGFAGAITAALFLRRFVGHRARYVHFDIYGWQPKAAAARPKGGVGQGARAILAALPGMLGL